MPTSWFARDDVVFPARKTVIVPREGECHPLRSVKGLAERDGGEEKQARTRICTYSRTPRRERERIMESRGETRAEGWSRVECVSKFPLAPEVAMESRWPTVDRKDMRFSTYVTRDHEARTNTHAGEAATGSRTDATMRPLSTVCSFESDGPRRGERKRRHVDGHDRVTSERYN